MQITVKSTKALKSGTNKNGEWELIGVTSEDGTNYTTFHKGAKNLSPGAVIEFEPEIKEGKVSFKEYKVISEGTPAPVNGKPDMTKEDWAEKDRADRWSKECNTCFMGIMDLAKVGSNFTEEQWIKLKPVYDAALDWADRHFKATTVKVSGSAGTATARKPEDKTNDPHALIFQNAGEFYSACLKYYKLNKTQVDKEIVGYDLSQPAGRLGAWAMILSLYGAKDEKDTTQKAHAAEGKETIEPDDLKFD